MKDLGHTRSLVIRCLVVKIEHLQEKIDVVTLKNHANHSVKQLSKLLSKFAYTNLYTKGPFFQVVVSVVRHKINPFNIKAVMLDHQCCIENAHLRRLV